METMAVDMSLKHMTNFLGGGDYIILGAFYNPNEITHLKEF